MRNILSGGQTGVDRATLDVGLALNIPVGGWCPQGRRAEDGIIPDRYRRGRRSALSPMSLYSQGGIRSASGSPHRPRLAALASASNASSD